MTTRADHYSRGWGGKWRKARVEHRCDWRRRVLGGTLLRCGNHVKPGEQYFDTGMHNPYSSNQHATYRICAACASEEI